MRWANKLRRSCFIFLHKTVHLDLCRTSTVIDYFQECLVIQFCNNSLSLLITTRTGKTSVRVVLEYAFTQIQLDFYFDLLLFQAHLLNVCVHELLLLRLVEQQAIDENEWEDGARTEISSFLNSRANASQPWGELQFCLHLKSGNKGTSPSIKGTYTCSGTKG